MTSGGDRSVSASQELAAVQGSAWLAASLYVSVGLVAGTLVALQIAIMRVFAVGSWAHIGSLVVSLAMLGLGLTGACTSVARNWCAAHWRGAASAALLAFGPLITVTNLAAQQISLNPMLLVADPSQKWRLLAIFLLYLVPFLAGFGFLAVVFLRARRSFGRIYFADLVGSGLCGLALLGAMYLAVPEDLIMLPLLLWFAGTVLWFAGLASRGGVLMAALGLAFATGAHFGLPHVGFPKLAVSEFKAVSYARNFPDVRRVYERASPFGYLEIYSSSFFHFAPGLSDAASLHLSRMPENAYLGMYMDGDGPSGIIRRLSAADSAYFRFLPMAYPYVIKPEPRTFIVQFGGGLPTSVALALGSREITIAEGNPVIFQTFKNNRALHDFTGDLLGDPKVHVIDHEGRLYLAGAPKRYDVIDLSLTDSAGLSSPGGYAIVEKYAYTREAMSVYMAALADGGVLSVTFWDKEEPPKAVLKLYATMVSAARASGGTEIARSFFVVASYLSTTTVLYKHGGFTTKEVEVLRGRTQELSFEEIYSPGFRFDPRNTHAVLDHYRNQIFYKLPGDAPSGGVAPAGLGGVAEDMPSAAEQDVPAITIARAAWHHLIEGSWDDFAARYVFDIRELTDARPYFAGYLRPFDLPRVVDRLQLVQDEWGYLLLWATLVIASLAALVILLFPVVFAWRAIFSRTPGKLRTMLYFACLGAGYIMVEIALLSTFVLALGSPVVSASVVIPGMLVSSGLGSFVSGRLLNRARTSLAQVLAAIGLILAASGLFLHVPLEAIGAMPYELRLICCVALVFPAAFLMGIPMPMAMVLLARNGKDHMYLWAWGINGCFSVIGSVIVPLIATTFGLAVVLVGAGVTYFVALCVHTAIVLPVRQS